MSVEKGNKNLEGMLRRLVKEAVHQTMEPAMAAGRTFDINGFNAFMRSEGLAGHEDNILSIVEGQPNAAVMNDVMEYVTFHKTGEDVGQLNAETMLDHYLLWNQLNIDKTKVLAFSISEQ
jgi:hypothetical protein